MQEILALIDDTLSDFRSNPAKIEPGSDHSLGVVNDDLTTDAALAKAPSASEAKTYLRVTEGEADFNKPGDWANVLGVHDKSKARKIEILYVLKADDKAVPLDSLQARLQKVALSDQKSTLLTQLSRMKKDNLIATPHAGSYEITEAGRTWHKKYSSVFENLNVPDKFR